jgi:hypothetical protein
MYSTLVKRSGLEGIKRTTPKPMPTLVNKPMEEIKAIIAHRNKMFKPV